MKYPPVEVIVEYDARGRRVTKAFTNHYEARRFYSAKLKAGASPKVRGCKARD